MKFKNLKCQICISILTPFIAIFIAIFILVSISAKKIILKTNLNIMETVARQAESTVESELSKTLLTAQILAENPTIKNPDIPWKEKKNLLCDIASKANHIRIAIITSSGELNSTDGLNFNASNTNFFKESINGKDFIYGPYNSKYTGEFLVSYSVPIKFKDKVSGVLIIVKDGFDFSRIIDNITFLQSGQAYVLNEEGTVIAHKNRDYVTKSDNTIIDSKTHEDLKPLADIEKLMITGKSGTSSYYLNGETNYIAYIPIKVANWSLAITVNDSDLLSGLFKLKQVLFFTIIFSSLATFLIISKISTSVLEKLSKVKSLFNNFSNGNFYNKKNLRN